MKKLLLVAAVAAFTVSMTSCKKDYTCTCKSTVTPSGGTATVTETKVEYKKVKEDDAKTSCDAGNSSSEIFGTTYKTECSLD